MSCIRSRIADEVPSEMTQRCSRGGRRSGGLKDKDETERRCELISSISRTTGEKENEISSRVALEKEKEEEDVLRQAISPTVRAERSSLQREKER